MTKTSFKEDMMRECSRALLPEGKRLTFEQWLDQLQAYGISCEDIIVNVWSDYVVNYIGELVKMGQPKQNPLTGRTTFRLYLPQHALFVKVWAKWVPATEQEMEEDDEYSGRWDISDDGLVEYHPLSFQEFLLNCSVSIPMFSVDTLVDALRTDAPVPAVDLFPWMGDIVIEHDYKGSLDGGKADHRTLTLKFPDHGFYAQVSGHWRDEYELGGLSLVGISGPVKIPGKWEFTNRFVQVVPREVKETVYDVVE